MLPASIKYKGEQYILVSPRTAEPPKKPKGQSGPLDLGHKFKDAPAYKAPLSKPEPKSMPKELGYGQRLPRYQKALPPERTIKLAPEQKERQEIQHKIIRTEREITHLQSQLVVLDQQYEDLVGLFKHMAADPMSPAANKKIQEIKPQLKQLDQEIYKLTKMLEFKRHNLAELKQKAFVPKQLERIDTTPLSLELSPADLVDTRLKRPATMLEKDVAFLKSHLDKLMQAKDTVTDLTALENLEKDIKETQEVIADKMHILSKVKK